MRLKTPTFLRSSVMLWFLYAAACIALIFFADRWEAMRDDDGGPASLRAALAFFLVVVAMLPPTFVWLSRRYTATVDVDVMRERPRWLSPAVAALALLLGAAAGGAALYQLARQSVLDATTHRLADVATLKVHLVDHWLEEMVENLDTWMASREFTQLVRDYRRVGYADGIERLRLAEYLQRISKTEHFEEVGARDARSGALLLTTTTESDAPNMRDQTIAAARTAKPVLEDVHGDRDQSPGSHIGLLVPVLEAGQPVVLEVVHVGFDPKHGLLPFLQQWPGSATSAQTLLVRVDRGDLVVLNEGVGGDMPEAPFRMPLSDPLFFAAGLGRAESGAMAGLDDRGKSVIAFAATVRGTPWAIVAKMNRAEAVAELDTIAMISSALATLLLMAGAWWWVQQQSYLAARVRHRLENAQFTHRIDFLAKHASDCIFLCDAQGRIVDVNDRCLAVYGYSREEMLGLSASDLRASDLSADIHSIVQRVEANGSALFESVHRRRDEHDFPVEVHAQAIDTGGRRSVQAVVRNISERKAAEARILALSRLYATISAVNQAIVRGRDIESVFSRVCEACVDHGRFRMAWVGLVSAGGASMRPVRAAGECSEFLDALISGPLDTTDGADPTSVAMIERCVSVCNNISGSQIWADWRERARRFGFDSAIALPLKRGEHTIGMLTVYGSQAHEFDDASVALLQEMAENLSFAIEHFEHESQRQKAETARVEHASRLAKLSRRVVQVQEEERRRLAADLHDTAGPNLAAAQLNLASVDNTLRGSSPRASEVLRETIALLAEVIVNVREICGELRPSVLDYLGLSPALEKSAQKFDRRGGMTVRFTPDPAIVRLPSDLESVLYRIAQEALTNCAKHAGARTVDLRLAVEDGLVRFTIVDDGTGFDLSSIARGKRAPGLGLLSMRERTEFMGGSFTVDSRPGHGTQITVELPLRDEHRPKAEVEVDV